MIFWEVEFHMIADAEGSKPVVPVCIEGDQSDRVAMCLSLNEDTRRQAATGNMVIYISHKELLSACERIITNLREDIETQQADKEEDAGE